MTGVVTDQLRERDIAATVEDGSGIQCPNDTSRRDGSDKLSVISEPLSVRKYLLI